MAKKTKRLIDILGIVGGIVSILTVVVVIVINISSSEFEQKNIIDDLIVMEKTISDFKIEVEKEIERLDKEDVRIKKYVQQTLEEIREKLSLLQKEVAVLKIELKNFIIINEITNSRINDLRADRS